MAENIGSSNQPVASAGGFSSEHRGGRGRGGGRGFRGGQANFYPPSAMGGFYPQYGGYPQYQHMGGQAMYGNQQQQQQQPFFDAQGSLIGYGYPQQNPAASMYMMDSSASGSPNAPVPMPRVTPFDDLSPEFCKALAKVAKPRPPWSIGVEPTEDINVEIGRLEAFFTPTDKDKRENGDVWDALRGASLSVSQSAVPMYTGCNSWSFYPYKGRLHVGISAISETPEAIHQLGKELFRNGASVTQEFVDSRGLQCLLVEHAATRRGVVLRLGKSAEIAIATVQGIRQSGMSPPVRQAINCLIVLLRQSKIIDDMDPNALCDEAVAVLALSIANSYPDRPTADRVVKDFFLTFGFTEHFDVKQMSVSMEGLIKQVANVHPQDSISVLDPGDNTRNLAACITPQKLTFLQGTLKYCYHVIAEFTKEANPQNRRGQSPLSTIVGGEPFWPRVVELAHLNVAPFHEFFVGAKDRAQSEAVKQAIRKRNPGAPAPRGGGGGGRR